MFESFYCKIQMMGEKFLEKIKSLNIWDYVICSGFSCVITYFLYKILYPLVKYENLKDFYVGATIYSNHNKFLDIWIFFVYLILFFIILLGYFCIKPVLKKYPFQIPFKVDLPDFKSDFTGVLSKHKGVFLTLEVFLSVGYVILHPFNGHFYINLAILIFLLIGFSIFHSYKNLYKNEIPSLSIFVFIPLLILLFGQGYNTGFDVGIDNHHSGEQIPVFFMNSVFGFEYYKDVMMVHGFVDVFPTFLGSIMFGENTLYTSLLGRSLFDNLIVFLTGVCAFYIFKKSPILISFSMFRAYNIPQLYILSFVLLLKDAILKRPFVWLLVYLFLSLILLFFWTTYGAFWLCATLPLAIFLIFKMTKEDKRFVKFSILALLFLGIFIFGYKFFVAYLNQAMNYISGNLYNFGNDFPSFKFSQIISDCIKLFALLIIPYFIVKLIQEVNSEKRNIPYLFLLIFSVIFVFVSLSYTLGRIDFIAMQRIRDISMSYLGIVIPYLLLLKNDKNIKYFKYVALLFFCWLIFLNIPRLNRWLPEIHNQKNTLSANIGEIKFDKIYQEGLEEVVSVVEKYSFKENGYLDLISGMNYFYLNRKMPIPYTSFYNVVNSSQDKVCADAMTKSLPDVVLISTKFYNYFDNVFPSLKVPNLTKNLLKSGVYTVLEKKHNVFLVKNNIKKSFSFQDLKLLDKKLAIQNIGYLPQAWGASIKTLPLEIVDLNCKVKKSKNKNLISFESSQSGEQFDLIELQVNVPDVEYSIKINNSPSTLFFKTKTTCVLFPFDNFPSWYLNKNLSQIEVGTDKPIDIIKVIFYKRK